MPIDTKTLIKPTVHLNGTGRRTFEAQYEKASEALRLAIKAVAEMGPNARDYYPQSDTAFYDAREQHRTMLVKVNDVKEYVDALWEHVANIEGNR